MALCACEKADHPSPKPNHEKPSSQTHCLLNKILRSGLRERQESDSAAMPVVSITESLAQTVKKCNARTFSAVCKPHLYYSIRSWLKLKSKHFISGQVTIFSASVSNVWLLKMVFRAHCTALQHVNSRAFHICDSLTKGLHRIQ